MVENAWIFLEIKDSIIPTHPRGETFEQWRPFYLICKDIGYEIVINETLDNRESKGKKISAQLCWRFDTKITGDTNAAQENS